MSRASSFSPAPPSTSTAAPLNMRKSSNQFVALPHSSQATATQATTSTGSQACFHTKSFKICLNDAHRKKLLEQVLRDNGATLLHVDSSTTPDFVVVEPKTSAASLRAFDDAGIVPVMHFWVEYCLHHDVFVEPNVYFAALPARVPQPLQDGAKLRLFLLGFEPDSPELYHAQKAVAEMGGTIAKQMKGESLTHVVCATRESFQGRRAQRARSCGVPVVGLEFIIKARQTGRLVPPPIPVAIIEQSSSVSGSTASCSANLAALPSTDPQRQADARASEPSLPLAGCTVSRSKVLASQSVVLERKVLQLGACWQAQANDATTHLLHRGTGMPREGKELDRSAFLVHPTWLDKCIEQSIRVDEALFPSSMDPSKSLLTVLSNSDGSAMGNFLSQASQSAMQPAPKPQPSKVAAQQTQAQLVAAAKPWHRSISADAARRTFDDSSVSKDDWGHEPRARGRSEEIEAPHRDMDDAAGDAIDFDADATLCGHVPDGHLATNLDESIAAPSSQTLFEGEEAEQDAPVGQVRSAAAPGSNKKDVTAPNEVDIIKKAKTRSLPQTKSWSFSAAAH